MHPVIRIVSLLVVAGALSLSAHGLTVLLAACLVLAGYRAAPAGAVSRLVRLLARLRWLWLSLFVVYFWFTPGTAIISGLHDWSPTFEGVRQGLVRVGILAVLAGAARLLLETTEQGALLGAIHWLAAPLDLLGGSRDRFAVRLVLVLDAVPRIEPMKQVGNRGQGIQGGRIGRLGCAAASLFRSALEKADATPTREIPIPDSGPPPRWQWLIPIALGTGLSALAHVL